MLLCCRRNKIRISSACNEKTRGVCLLVVYRLACPPAPCCAWDSAVHQAAERAETSLEKPAEGPVNSLAGGAEE